MRNLAWMSLLAASLAVGCTGAGKRPSPPSPTGFSSAAGERPDTGATRRVPARTHDILAGQVKDAFDREGAKASILISQAPNGRTPPSAPITIQADEHGFFYIPELDSGQPYQLVARLTEGTRITATGSTWARPPNPTVFIRVSADLVTPNTPPVEPRPTYPEEKADKGKKKKETTPAASIERPVLPRSEAASETGASLQPIAPPPAATPEPRHPRPDLRTNVPGPGAEAPSELPPVPRLPTPPAPPATAPLSRKPPQAPWCVLVGNTLEDFALNDLNGKTWEFRRDRVGKLVLLDFWSTRCLPCLRAIRELNEMQRVYGPNLEIVGIACDGDPPQDRAGRVRSMRWGGPAGPPVRFDYRILLWGDRGRGKPCPVFTDFNIQAFPTVKLIKEDGSILWQSVGLEGSKLNELKCEIEKHLGRGRR